MNDTRSATAVADAGDRTVNGVDLDTLMGTVAAIQAQPALGASRFRAGNRWLGGTRNRSTVTGFHGAGEEIRHLQTFGMEADEPPILAGEDRAANPVEHLLHALASCVTTSMVAHAAVRGIHLDEVSSELEGDIDLRGFLGLDGSVPCGFTDIRVTVRARAKDADAAQLASLARFSPVFNTVTRGARVDLRVHTD